MKVSKAVAAEHQRALLEAAGALYRERGFDGVSIADIGARAGLSHGALYGHFRSKDNLQAATVPGLFGWTAGQVQAAPDLKSFLDLYLSHNHLDHPAMGCPLAALGNDTARADSLTHDAFAAGLESSIEALKTLANTDRKAALTALACLVGAITLARATGGDLSDEILTTVRNSLGKKLGD